jgi:hypothetical protein
MKKSQPTPKSKNTESQMREKWKNMGKELEFKKDSATMKNALKDYRSVQIMYPKMGGEPDVLAMTNSYASGGVRGRHAEESGLRAMQASNDFEKVVSVFQSNRKFVKQIKIFFAGCF